ncbi:MAG TPA: hypothetical protein VLX92_12270 [Kofleriaceae bacterium]|nr:hypothetical protein [Kofleriaceae bacterium]
MLNLGHNHPDFVYPNDQRQAALALWLSAIAAVASAVIIVAMILSPWASGGVVSAP